VYGQPVSPQRADVYAKSFSALRAMGFRETEVRCALEQVRARIQISDPDIKQVLREALRVLGEARYRSS
jgi:Holliday junction resolvasome RuvABC DNA-binding subunit